MAGTNQPRPLAPKRGYGRGLPVDAAYAASAAGAQVDPYVWSPNTSIIQSPSPASTMSTEIPKSKRNCVSNACIQCRKKRSKCDGLVPCAKCVAAGKADECKYDVENDHRRKGALRKRNEELEKELKRKEEQMDVLLRALRNSDDDSVRRIVKRIKREANLDSIVASLDSTIHRDAYDTDNHTENEYEPDTPRMATAEQMSTRQIASPKSRPRLTPPRSFMEPGKTQTVRPSSWTTVTSDDELVLHFMALYFTWDHPWFRPFSEAKFRADFESGGTRYCSSMLVNAICAVGCHYSRRAAAYDGAKGDVETLGNHFGDMAIRQLLEERQLNSGNHDDERRISRLTTMQAVIVIAVRESAIMRDAQGDLYISTFTKLLQSESFISLFAPGALNPEDSEYNGDFEDFKWLFWSYFAVNASWSMGLMRAPTVMQDYLSLDYPSITDDLNCPWYPYKEGPYNIEVARKESSKYIHPVKVYHYQLDIFKMLYEITSWLHKSEKAQLTPDMVLKFYKRMMDWRRGLPEEIQNTVTTTSPWVLLMNMLHRTVKIALLRPFCTLRINKRPSPNSPTPLALATTAAKELLGQLKRYQELCSAEYAPSMLTQFLVACCNIRRLEFPERTAIQDYKEAVEILQSLGDSFIVFKLAATSFRMILEKQQEELSDQLATDDLRSKLASLSIHEDKLEESKYFQALVDGATGVLAPGFSSHWEPLSAELLEKTKAALQTKRQTVDYLLN